MTYRVQFQPFQKILKIQTNKAVCERQVGEGKSLKYGGIYHFKTQISKRSVINREENKGEKSSNRKKSQNLGV